MSKRNEWESIVPLHDYVLIELDEQKNEVGGIIISKQEKGAESAKVLAVGPDADLKVGDKIMFSDFTPIPVKLGDKEYWFIKYEDIICLDVSTQV